MSEVIKRITGEDLDPAKINPYGVERQKSESMKRIEAMHKRYQWRAMFGPKG